jgi:hypothetical protein
VDILKEMMFYQRDGISQQGARVLQKVGKLTTFLASLGSSEEAGFKRLRCGAVALAAFAAMPVPSFANAQKPQLCSPPLSEARRLVLERIPVTFEHSLHGERSSCILAG